MSDNSEDILVNDNQFLGYSYSKAYATNYTWKINDMTKLIEFVHEQEKDFITISPEFSTGAKDADPWYLQLTIKPGFGYYGPIVSHQRVFEEIINHRSSCVGDNISITLVQKNSKLVRIKFKLFLLNDDEEKIQGTCGYKTCLGENWAKAISPMNKCEKVLNVNSGILFNPKEKLLENDTLTVGVELIVYDYVSVNNPNAKKDSELKFKSINNDFKDLFLGKIELKKDVMIRVGDYTFEAHKFVLITRSSFFEAKFMANGEKVKNVIDMSDVDPKIFEKLLKFIYTDIIDLNGCAEELLKVAHKYELRGLKKMCKEFLANNYIELKNTKELNNLKKSYPLLYTEVLEKIAEIVIKG